MDALNSVYIQFIVSGLCAILRGLPAAQGGKENVADFVADFGWIQGGNPTMAEAFRRFHACFGGVN